MPWLPLAFVVSPVGFLLTLQGLAWTSPPAERIGARPAGPEALPGSGISVVDASGSVVFTLDLDSLWLDQWIC